MAPGETARVLGIDVEVVKIDSGLDVRAGLRARVGRAGEMHDVALADLVFPHQSELGLVVAAYRRWLGWR